MPTAADRAAWACRFSCTLGRAGIGCASDPVRVPVPTNQRRWSANRSTGSPTVMIGFCCLRRSNSSSSSHLCKLWRTSVSAGQPDDCPVGYLWRTRGITRAVVHRARVTPSPSTVVHWLSTGYPPTFSPGLWIVWCVLARTVPRTFNSLSTTARILWTTEPLPTGIHSITPRVIHSLWVTGRVPAQRCPPDGPEAVDNGWELQRRSGVCPRATAELTPAPPPDSAALVRSGGVAEDSRGRSGPAARCTPQVFCLIRLVSSAIWL